MSFFRKLHTVKEISKMDAGEIVGRVLVLVVYGGGLSIMAYSAGLPIWSAFFIIAGYLFMAMEKRI